MKKTELLLVILFLCISLFSCGKTGDVSANDANEVEKYTKVKPELSDEDDKKRREVSVINDGVYEAEDFALEITSSGYEKVKNLNAVLYRKDSGSPIFTGVVFDARSEFGKTEFVATDGTNTTLSVTQKKEDCKVLYKYLGNTIEHFSGKYCYTGDNFISYEKSSENYILPGTYNSVKNNFRLTVEEKDGVMYLSIIDKTYDTTVYENKLTLSQDENNEYKKIEKATLRNNATGTDSLQVIFQKKTKENVQFISVNGYGNSTAVDYFGDYLYDNPYNFVPSYFKNEGGTVSITGSSIDFENAVNEIFTYKTTEGKFFDFGTVKVENFHYPSVVTFKNDFGTVKFFKCCQSGHEYLEVLNLGYTSIVGTYEKYEPFEK